MKLPVCSLLLATALPAAAAIRVWDGGSPLVSTWTTPQNWQGDVAPVAGDSLVFPQVAARKTNTNTFPPGTAFNSIQVSGTDYVLNGSEVVVSALTFFITTAGTAPEVNLPLRASGPFGVQMTSDTVTPGNVKGGINNGGFPVTLNNLSIFVPMDIRSAITGAGGVTKSGPGVVAMSGTSASTYAGTTTVDSGVLSIGGSNTPGDATGGTVVNSAGRLSIGCNELTENLTLNGTLTTGVPGDIVLHGSLDVANSSARLDFTSLSGNLTLDGAITGAFPLVKSGPGLVLFAGNQAWTAPGLTIEDGRVILLRSGAAAGGVFTLGDGSGLTDSAVLQAGSGAQLAVGASLIIKPDGAYDLAGHVQTLNGSISLEQGHLNAFGDLKLGGTITTLPAPEPSLIEGYIQLTASAAWNIADGTAPADLRMAAEITDATTSPRITKSGAGRLDWTGNSAADFELSATAGTLLVNGVNPEVRVFGSAGASIGGSGTVARLDPNDGSAANILPGGSAAGRVETRTLLFGPAAPGGTLRIQLNGPAPGTSHDQVRIAASAVVNSIRLDGGTLDVVSSNGFQPAFGQVFTIIDNQDDDTTLGTFTGLPEASVLTLNGKQLRLSYAGGDGNDVTLTGISPSGILRTWTGGGTTNNWSDAGNWGGTAPGTGDRLLFPEGAPRAVNLNDFAEGFVVDSITLQGGGWNLAGHGIALLNGFVFSGSGTLNVVNLAVTLAQSQNWSTSRGPSDRTQVGLVNLGAFDLSLTGPAGIIRFTAPVSGTGGLTAGSGVGCELFAANTFAGALTLQNGSYCSVPNSAGLGDVAGATVLEDGATLNLTTSGFNSAEPFVCSGGKIFTAMNGPVLSGPITLSSGPVSIETGSSGALTLSGVISGPGRLLKTGAGTLTLSGTGGNNHRYTTVSDGSLLLQKTGSVFALMNDVTVGGGATVRLLAPGQFHSGATNLAAEPGSVLDLNGFTSAIPNVTLTGASVLTGTASGLFLTANLVTGASTSGSTIAGPGAVRIGTHRTWTVEDGLAENDLTVSAIIESTDSAVLSKSGAGHMVSTAVNTIPLIRIEEGSLELAGDSPASGVVLSGGTLYGQGRVASVTLDSGEAATSFIEPGMSPGRFTTDVLQAPSGSGNLVIDIAGPTAATGYDQIRINPSAAVDAVNLSAFALSVRLTPAYTPPLGSTFRILDNDSADTNIVEFLGKAEGSMVTDGYVQFTISYAGGDAVLTTTGYFGSDRFWTGAGANNLWSTPANWEGNNVPQPGDRVYFPAGAARLQNVNDLPAGRFFSGIGIIAPGYDISGNAVALGREFGMSHSTGSSTFSLPVTLQADVLWYMTGAAAGACFCNGDIFLAGHDLTIGGGIAINGIISGAGTVWLEPVSGNPATSSTSSLGGANTYTGRTVITGLSLVVNHPQALGSTANQTRINAGATLRNSSGQPVAEPLVLAGTLVSTTTGTDLYSGGVEILGDSAAIQPLLAASIIELTGNLTGDGTLTFNGPGRTRFSGAGTSTFAGSTAITLGTVELARSTPGASGTLGNDIHIVAPNGQSANLFIDRAAAQLGPNAVVETGSGGFLTLNGHTESIASLVLNGGAVSTTTASGELTIGDLAVDSSIRTSVIHGPGTILMASAGEWSIPDGSSSPDLEVSAVIAGAAITKTGGGSLLSTRANTISDIVLAEGTASFDGLSPATAVIVQNATLMGSGQLRMVQVEDNSLTARIAPGASAGRLRANALLFPASAEGILEIELGGAAPGTGFDQFQVESSAINNSVNLNGAALDLKLINGFTPAIGANFRILNNLDGDTSTGTFLGQPEASTFTAGGFTWSITYTGGDGNDVVITRINPSGVPAPAVVNFTSGFDPNAGGAGVPGYNVAFTGQGSAGQPYKLQGSRNLTTWVDLATATASGSGVITFNFTDTANLPRRLYRVVVP